MPATKLYCYVDETGQDTKGELFLVAIVLKEITDLFVLEKQLEEIEKKTGKKLSKWKKTRQVVKKKYLKAIIQLKNLKNSIYYAVYNASKEYSKLTALTIAKAVLAKDNKNYTVTIIIDGLNNREREIVRSELKKLKIKYRKIRGLKDEQSAFLRLADAMAGFLRDMREQEPYAKPFIKDFLKKEIVAET